MRNKFHRLASITLAVAIAAGATVASAQVMVGGASMLPTKDIIDKDVNSKDGFQCDAMAGRPAP